MIRALLLGIAALSLFACAAGRNPDALNLRLVKAAETGNTDQVIELLKAGADIEAHDAEGFTPYLAASSNGHLQTMKLLKGLGAKTMVDEKYLDERFLAQMP